MKSLHIITPVKNSIDTTIDTIDAVLASKITVPFRYTVYNDFSTPQNTALLEKKHDETGGAFELVNLAELTEHPSPNYDLVLQMAQRDALAADAGILIIESDITMPTDAIQRLFDETLSRPDCGLAASVTVNEQGDINYPYDYAHDWAREAIDCQRHLSFCFTLITPMLLRAIDFATLDPKRDWYDIVISHASRRKGFKNYLFNNIPVLHRPHSSRPWKKIKYQNPLKYYWLKYIGAFRKRNNDGELSAKNK